MTANCRRCHGLGSTLAPASRRIVNFLRFGSTAAIAGRSTPGSTPITNIEIAIAAPVFPAEIKAAALPSLTSSAATLSEESRLRRSACDGRSPMPTTWEAWRTSSPRLCAPRRVTSRSMAARSPTRMTEAPNSRTAATAPSTTTAGPWPPPPAPTATLRRGPLARDASPSPAQAPASRAGHTRPVGGAIPARAGDHVPVAPTDGAQAQAIVATERLHGKRQRRLRLDQNAEVELVLCVELHVEVVGGELDIVRGGGARDHPHVHGRGDTCPEALEAAAAHLGHGRADLAVHQDIQIVAPEP